MQIKKIPLTETFVSQNVFLFEWPVNLVKEGHFRTQNMVFGRVR